MKYSQHQLVQKRSNLMLKLYNNEQTTKTGILACYANKIKIHNN